jgi:hypothetical protein
VTKQTFQHMFRDIYWPNLDDDNHEVTSPKDEKYNCIAWAYGINNKWIWPGTEDCFWPNNIPQDDELEAVTQLFISAGYEKCDNCIMENGYKKVAIYAKPDGPTHAAFQLASGKWSSKVGGLEDIEHNTVKELEGNRYGEAILFLKKKIF